MSTHLTGFCNVMPALSFSVAVILRGEECGDCAFSKCLKYSYGLVRGMRT